MKLRLSFPAAAAMALLLAQLAVGQIPQIKPFSANLQVSTTGRADGQARDMDGKMFVSQEAMRTEMQGGPRGSTVVLVNFPTQTTDVLLPDQKMYMEHKAGEMAGRMGSRNPVANLRPVNPDDPCAGREGMTCKKIGTETVNGRTCDHWEFTDSKGTVSNAWVDQTLHFPIKTVSQGSTVELTDIQEGPQEASLFQIPAGYTKMDMNNMRGMGGPLPGAAPNPHP